MSQAIQVIPSASKSVTSGASPGLGTESPDSGPSFESALAGQFKDGEAPVGETGTTASAIADTPPPDVSTSMAAALAASGNALPPSLPPAPVDLAALVTAGTEVLTDPIAGTSAAQAMTDDLKKNISTAPEALANDLLATAPQATLPATMMTASATLPAGQLPVVLSSKEGQSQSASVETALNRPTVANMATRTAAADAQTLAALTAEDAGTVGPAKSADLPASLDVFRSVLKEIAPTTADVRPAMTSLLAASAAVPTSSFAGPLASNQTSAAPLASATIAVPFGQANWGQAFGNQVVWAVNQGMPGAELHLSPPDLGPMSVRISMDQDQASMAFSSPHAMVREAIEAALPRLRDMLGSQGITLADVNVSQHGAPNSQREPGEWRNGPTADNTGSGQGSITGAVLTRTAVGMLDVYV